jgi:hypothetical protein
MATDFDLLIGRLWARRLGRAFPIRSTYSVAPDPPETFGVAFICVAGEERVQAVAYGLKGTRPTVITICNPLGRGAHELEPFARALDGYLTGCYSRGRLPRVWLAHPAALTVLDLLGYRYQSNRHASETMRAMGRQCRALCEEATFPGQQVLAVAAELLAEHIITGQSAVEDQHLGSMLAWINPPQELDPTTESQRQSLIPAAALLDQERDKKVERLRRLARKCVNKDELESINDQIRAILEEGVAREWSLLEEARTAFWQLRLAPAPTRYTKRLVEESRERLRYFISVGTNPPSRPHSLALRLNTYEYAAALVEERDACCDALMRERMRKAGRVIAVRVESVDQPAPGRNPCRLTLTTDQAVLRVRPGTRLKSVDDRIQGRVVALAEGAGGKRCIVLLLVKGVRKGHPHVGQQLDLIDTVPFDSRRVKRAVYKLMRQDEPSIVYHNRLPQSVPRHALPDGLLDLAEGKFRR